MYPNGKLALFSVLLALLVLRGAALSQHELIFEFCTGVPYNIPLPLTILQSGQPDVNLTAHYSSEPFVVPISWVWRIGYWSGNRGWELEANHHKIFLNNRPPEVQVFSISHGLNLITINRVFDIDSYLIRIGAGIALIHPENTVRGKVLSEDRGIFRTGYYVKGPAISLSAGKRLSLVSDLFFTLEAKVFGSYSSTPVAEGAADVYSIVVQAGFGVGYEFGF